MIHATWWRHEMETISPLQDIWEGNLTENGGLPSQKASNTGIWCIIY